MPFVTVEFVSSKIISLSRLISLVELPSKKLKSNPTPPTIFPKNKLKEDLEPINLEDRARIEVMTTKEDLGDNKETEDLEDNKVKEEGNKEIGDQEDNKDREDPEDSRAKEDKEEDNKVIEDQEDNRATEDLEDNKVMMTEDLEDKKAISQKWIGLRLELSNPDNKDLI